jgi:hypothetical protein
MRLTPPSRHGAASRPFAVALIGVITLFGVPVWSGVPARAAAPVRVLQAPVDDPIAERFRAPSSAYGPGNRGLDYLTAPGASVHAAAPGRVVFAGPVGGSWAVTVSHDGGLRTSYSYLAAVNARVGAIVSAGEAIGTSSGHLQFGLRAGDLYLDPEQYLSDARPRLVPVPAVRAGSGGGWGLGTAARWLARHGGDLIGLVGGTASSVTGSGSSLVWLAAHYANEVSPVTHLLRLGRVVLTWARATCTSADHPVPRSSLGTDVVIEVAGFGSSSERSVALDRLDVASIGGSPMDTIRFSYNGGRIPAVGLRADLAEVSESTYAAQDSEANLPLAGRRLAELIMQVKRARPGARIHLIAHSQGGLVAVLALRDVASRTPALGLDAVTVASPHQGDTAATAADLASHLPIGTDVLVGLEALSGSKWSVTSEAARQLSAGSDFLRGYVATGAPAGIPITSIGNRSDLLVPGLDTVLPGARNRLVAGPLTPKAAHEGLFADRAVTDEIARAVHGQAPTCQSLGSLLADAVVADAVRTSENAAVVAAAGGLGLLRKGR